MRRQAQGREEPLHFVPVELPDVLGATVREHLLGVPAALPGVRRVDPTRRPHHVKRRFERCPFHEPAGLPGLFRDTEIGAETVLDTPGRIEHGVFG